VAAYIAAELIEAGQTLQAIYTVPAGYTGILLGGHASGSKGAACTVSIQTRPPGGAWNTRAHHPLYESQVSMDSGVIAVLTPLTDIRMVCDSDVNNTQVSGDFHLLLVKNA
jgi:hypothetical protein